MERIVPGLLIAGFWLLLLLFGSIQLFSLVVGLIVLVAADEYLQMAESRQLSPIERGILDCIIALPALGVCIVPDHTLLPGLCIASFGMLTAYFLFRYQSLEGGGYNLFSRLVFGLLYIGLLGAHVCLIRVLPDGASWLIIASAITACSDSGAYFVGKKFGRRKLCPNVSPNKTIEGAVGGVLSALAASLLFGYLLLVDLNLPFLITSAIILSIVGIVGDLTESIIKRGTYTKDSGTLLAGHGGVLDRVDSLLFVAPVLYYLLVLPVI